MAQEACDFKLQADLTVACDDMSNSGLKNTGYIVNYDDIDWDNLTYKEGTKNVVTQFLLKSDTRGYKVYIPGNTPFTGTNKALVTGTYRNKFTKHVSLIVLNNGADVSEKIIDKLANGA